MPSQTFTSLVRAIHQLSARLRAGDSQQAAVLAGATWQAIADELVPLIGEEGFAILYARSLHLTRAAFPWLADTAYARFGDGRFALLQRSIAAHPFGEAGAASCAMFETFTQILVVLIGEPLTTGILFSVWGD